MNALCQKGYLTVELMIALGILVTGLLGIVTLSSNSIGLSRVLSNQFIANYLAAEGIEVVKNNIDAGVLAGEALWAGFQIERVACYQLQYNTTNMANAPRVVGCEKAMENGLGLGQLLFNEDTAAYQYDRGVPTGFKRVVQITKNPSGEDANQIQVNSVVFSDVRGARFSINIEDHFFNRK